MASASLIPRRSKIFTALFLRPISIRALIRSDMDRCDVFLMFHIVRHLSHKSIICQNNRTFHQKRDHWPRRRKKHPRDGQRSGKADGYFLLIEQRLYLHPIRIRGDGSIPAFVTQTRDQIVLEKRDTVLSRNTIRLHELHPLRTVRFDLFR